MKLHKISTKITQLQSKIEDIPWSIWTCFWETKPDIAVFGDEISFKGDFKSVKEMRKGVEWLADQLGGTVEWK